jgi:hypothetical protein
VRIRSTKPEFWRSNRIASVEWHARLVLKGLESFVDDNGVGKDDLALIVGDLFQRDLVREPSRTLARVSEALSELHEAGLIWRYEVDGTALLYISFWETVQRVDKPQKGRYPRPDGTMDYKESEIRESSGPVANIREDSRSLAPGTGEQGNRGTELTPRPDKPAETRELFALADPDEPTYEIGSDDDPDFCEFWAAVPKKDGKTEARAAWRNHVQGKGTYKGTKIPKTEPAVIIAGMLAYAERVRREGIERKHIKMAEGWLNGRRWEDEQQADEHPAQGAWSPMWD